MLFSRVKCGFNKSLNGKRHLSKWIMFLDRLNPALQKVSFPERLKGTFIEKWANYWKGVFSDYAEVGWGITSDAASNPRKATAILASAAFLGYCFRSNPDEALFRNLLMEQTNTFALVSKPIRNPKSVGHIVSLAAAYDAGLVRRLSVGLFSVIWVADYTPTVGQYKATCDYLSPYTLRFYERIVDIGFLSHWWLMEYKMNEYDVNPEEWDETKFH